MKKKPRSYKIFTRFFSKHVFPQQCFRRRRQSRITDNFILYTRYSAVCFYYIIILYETEK